MMRKKILEAITKTVTEISENLFEEIKATTKTNEVWNEQIVHEIALQLLKQSEVIDLSSIRPLLNTVKAE